MNEDDADETTKLMSDASPAQSYDEDGPSRDRRHRRREENYDNAYTVRLQRTRN